ncbi:MAG: restriction endonuclease [Nanoarchaeota archaeon]|nr:restriction endonuclease [Nanoarchaeota archaeon]
MVKSDLPFGSEFSPFQIDLIEVLEIASRCQGDWKKFEEQIRKRYFQHNKTSDYNKMKLANNCKLGMIAYGLIDRDSNLTEIGNKLLKLKQKPIELYTLFAKHIMLNRNGLLFIQCIQDMTSAGEKIDLIKLRQGLSERGINFPRGGKHPSILRLWLEMAGIFEKGSWRINQNKLNQIMGVSSTEIEQLSVLTPEQRAYVKTLANLSKGGPFFSNDIEKMATAIYGIKFNEKNLPKQVLYPLEKAGYIKLERGTKAMGRGAKPFSVYPTKKMANEILRPVIAQLEKQVIDDIRPLLLKPLNEILSSLDSPDKHLKGLALEALAFKLLRLIDLTYIATRLRGIDTGGAEVDLIFEGDRLLFSRWQIQCKNTKSVSIDAVAKEVGLTHALKSNVIVIVSTGAIGGDARTYAETVMKTSNIDIILIDKCDLTEILRNPITIIDILNREAKNAMKLKKLNI